MKKRSGSRKAKAPSILSEIDCDVASWSCKLIASDTDPSKVFNLKVQYALKGLELIVQNTSVPEIKDKDVLKSKLFFHLTETNWYRQLDWTNEVTIAQWIDQKDLTIFDHLYRKILTIRFTNTDDVMHFRMRINQDRYTLIPWNEYEIAERIGAAQWYHYHQTFDEAKVPWPAYMVNIQYLTGDNSSEFDSEEDIRRKERMFIELVVRVRRQYITLKKQLENEKKPIKSNIDSYLNEQKTNKLQEKAIDENPS